MSHDHNLHYVLKTDDKGALVGRVAQLPGIIVQGKSQEEIAEKISKTTRNYLHTFEDEHERIKKDTTWRLNVSGYGTIIASKPFKITC